MSGLSATSNYLVATIKPWNIRAFDQFSKKLPGRWHLLTDPRNLILEYVDSLNPRYIFFPHWSWIVSEDIINKYTCVCFHMADVPFGRGGSPLQNLIIRGIDQTQVSALRMVQEMDAGPVYLKRPLSLKGSAAEIYQRLANSVYEMMAHMIEYSPSAIDQQGDVVLFTRRTPSQSEIPTEGDLKGLYDHIRMLDADTYPRAFLNWGNWRIEFNSAAVVGDKIEVSAVMKARTSR